MSGVRRIKVIRSVVERLFDRWNSRTSYSDVQHAYHAGYVRAMVHANEIIAVVDRNHLGDLDALRADVNKWRNMSEEFSAEVLKLKRERRLLKAAVRSSPELSAAVMAVLDAGGRVWIPPDKLK